MTAEIFDTQYANFIETEKDRRLYPNILSAYNDPQNFRSLFKFFGMMVGKALLEGILLKANFATFFLNHMVNKSNQVDDLKALDPQLYENLLHIKYYDAGNVQDLGLTMAVTQDNFGVSETISLVPNGENVEVTNENKLAYIMYYANYMLNTRTME